MNLFTMIWKKNERNYGNKGLCQQKVNGKGKIEIEYYSDEELERLFEMIMSIREEVR